MEGVEGEERGRKGGREEWREWRKRRRGEGGREGGREGRKEGRKEERKERVREGRREEGSRNQMYYIPYSRLFWRALNLANWSKNVIGEFKFGECMFHAQVLCMTTLIIDTHDIKKLKSVCFSQQE